MTTGAYDGITVLDFTQGIAGPHASMLLALHGAAAEVLEPAVEVAELLSNGGLEVLLDDRAQRPGEKFADADLLQQLLRPRFGRIATNAFEIQHQFDVLARGQGREKIESLKYETDVR